jgi:glucan 1,3-beta-glucosidase
MAWGLRIQSSKNVYVYGAGLYNFFQNYDQSCLDSENCQESMVQIVGDTSSLYLYNLNTKAASNMIKVDGTIAAYQVDNRNTFCSNIAGFLAKSNSVSLPRSFLE